MSSLWTEYKNSEGRVYWSNSQTQQSVWEKPDELKTPFEKAMGKTSWKQYISKGKPYYVHSVTKETKWDMPDELVDLKERVEAEEAYRAERKRRVELGLPSPTPPRGMSPGLVAHDGNALERYRSLSPTRSESPEPVHVIRMPPGGFASVEEAEEGFTYLLKREKVDETWTWDQTMRKIIMDPLYKALDTLAQKKAVFERYTANILAERNAAKEARIAKLKPALIKLFTTSGYIKPYSTMKTADRVFARERVWRDTKPEERRLILDEYVSELKRKEQDAEAALRKRNIDALTDLVRRLDVTVSTTWRNAHNLILASSEFKHDRELSQIETVDMLMVYDDYMRQLELEHEDEEKRARVEQYRRYRKAREAFKGLLSDLESRGELKRTSKWKHTYKLVRDDERYRNLLGIPGSTAMDLWMDAVDDSSEEIDRAAAKLERVDVNVDTTFDEFEAKVKEAHLDQVEPKLRREAYELIIERLEQQRADEARRAERKRRHRMDDLRYALKKVARHIDVDMSYEEALPHMRELPEFGDIPEEEDRRAAYEKFIKRQKEKLYEADRGSEDRRDRRDKDKRDKGRDRSPEEREKKRPRVDKRDDEVEEGEI